MKKLRDYNFVVFGSTGWIGKNFIKYLSEQKCNIFLFSHKSHKKIHINGLTYKSLPISNALDLELGNTVLIDLAFPTREKIDILGNSEYKDQIDELQKIKKVFLEKNHISQVFLSSTGAVYKSEDLYSVNKQLEENFYIEYSKKFNFSLDVARIFACIGPYYNKHDFYAFSSFMNKAIKGETIIIKSLREVYRSYIYIPNLIEFFISNFLNSKIETVQIYDAIQDNLEIRQLAKIIADTFDVNVDDNYDYKNENKPDKYLSNDKTLITYLKNQNINPSITEKEILASQIN